MDKQALKTLISHILEENSSNEAVQIVGENLQETQENLVLVIQLIDLIQEKEMNFEQAWDFYWSDSKKIKLK